MKQLTSAAGRNYAPVVSPDNRYVVFHSNRTGVFQIWRIDRDGSSPKQLTFEVTESTWPTIFADGKWVFFSISTRVLRTRCGAFPIDGGTPEDLLQASAIRPTISPDGKLIAFWYNDGRQNSRWRLKVMQLEGGATFNTFDVAQTVQVQWDTPLRWSPDGRFWFTWTTRRDRQSLGTTDRGRRTKTVNQF